MKKWIFNVFIVIISVIFLISVFCFLNGSFETYPTDEQKEKVRIVSSIIGTICLIIDVILIRLRITRG